MTKTLEMAAKLESDLQDTVDLGRKWPVDFNAGKIQLVSFEWSNNTGAIDVKMNGSVVEEDHLLRCWGCLLTSSFTMLELSFSFKLDWDSLSLLLKLPPRKLDP